MRASTASLPRAIAALAIAACSSSPAPASRDEPPTTRDPWDRPAAPASRDELSAARDPPAAPAEPRAATDPNAALSIPPVLLVPASAPEPIATPAPRQLVTAMPGELTRTIAVTDDGRVAVTADATRYARVWPSLDGKREPVVVEMRSPIALAITRHGDRLAIAGLDAAGQLELVVTTPPGEVVGRFAVESARPITAVHAVPRGFLALDDTRAIVLLDPSGSASGPLVADAGEHVLAIATRGEHAIAIVESAGAVHGRWIELAGVIRWGAGTPALPIAGERVALSPTGKRLAALSRDQRKLAIVELATGKRLAHVDNSDAGAPLTPIGFTADGSLAYTDAGGRVLWSTAGGQSKMFGVPMAVGGALAVAPFGSALALGTAGEVAYLGYRMGGPYELIVAGDGLLAGDHSSVVELDARFRTRRVHELPSPQGDPRPRPWHGVHLIDERRVLASTYRQYAYELDVIDLVTHEVSLVASNARFQAYERATRMIAYRTDAGIEVVQLDPETGRVGEPASIPHPRGDRWAGHLLLLDPARAEGNVGALIVLHGTTRATVTIIRTFSFGGSDEAFEAASTREVELSTKFWERGGDVTTLVPRGWAPPTDRVRSPDGRHVVEHRAERIRLVDARGREVWTIPARSAQHVMWTPAGKLLAYGSGIAEIDVATGALVARQCGWRFGKWDTNPEASGATGLCEAP